jgi:enamine deaminase RidA (YjgF/YER057c/UK114 family)
VKLRPVNPETLAAPRGFSHGMRGAGEVLFVAGQVGWDKDGRFVSDDFASQFAQALDNVLAVVRAAGGSADCIGRMTLYVVDKAEYSRSRKKVGAAYRERMGGHYPAMALVEVRSLLEDRARLEIEATAVLPAAAR